jgi:hypothetical protein
MTTIVRRGAYSARHPESPIALAWDTSGPVHVADHLRADIANAVGRRDLQRAYGLAIISASAGLEPDVHQHETGLWPDIAHPADYLTTWIRTGLQWADGTADDVDPDADDKYAEMVAAEVDEWAVELVKCAPAWYLDWAGRLVHPPKYEYLIRLGAHQWLGTAEPADPGTGWSRKIDAQWSRRSR